MSAKIMGLVWKLDLPQNEQSVLLALADHADHEGNNIFPSNGLVAWKLGVNQDTVRRMKRLLEERGLLVAVDWDGGNKKGQGVEYRIDLSKGVKKASYTGKPTPRKIRPPQITAPINQALLPPVNGEPPNKGTVINREPSFMHEIPSELKTSAFLEAWEAWLNDRKARGKKVTELAAKLQLEKLKGFGAESAIQSINLSIENGYTGLFQPRKLNDSGRQQKEIDWGRSVPKNGF